MSCQYKPTERIGLYIMVFFILLHSCDINDSTERIERKVDRIEIIAGECK